MKLPRRQFLHLAAGAAALPAVSRIAWAQSLSDAADPARGSFSRRVVHSTPSVARGPTR